MSKPYYDLTIDRKTDKITRNYIGADLEEVVLDCKQIEIPNELKELPSSFIEKHGWKIYSGVFCAGLIAGKYILENQRQYSGVQQIFTESTPEKYMVAVAGAVLLGVIGGTAVSIISYVHKRSRKDREEEEERNRFK